MRLFLALSCLQGRPLQDAFEALAPLADGVQLTPGCAPTVGFETWAAAQPVATRTHHGYTPHAYRARVWSEGFALEGDWDSVHPPRGAALDAILALPAPACLEVMYPGEGLGDGASVEAAMAAGLTLAVDVSHIHIQREQGAMTAATWRKLQDYPRIGEVHVSANDGRRDRHQPLTRGAFGLDWARERAASGAPLVLEAYFHQLTEAQRREQVALVREGS